jgi:hypothetical protein
MLMPRTHARPRRGAGPRGLAAALALAAGLAAGSCLPGDERPDPGVASAWLSAGQWLEQRAPFVTDDGWSIVFERVLVASSGVSESYNLSPGFGGPLGDGCESYYDTTMIALYDVVVPGPKLIGRLAGLGACGFGVNWYAPPVSIAPFDVLGPGVTADDANRVVTPVAGEFNGFGSSDEHGAGDARPVLYLVGVASKEERAKSFALPFSSLLSFGACGYDAFAVFLEEGKPLDVSVSVFPERIFFDNVAFDQARPRFDPFAAADDRGDGDGVVTRAELAARHLTEFAGEGGAYQVSEIGGPLFPGPEGGMGGQLSLLDFINWQAQYVFLKSPSQLCSR